MSHSLLRAVFITDPLVIVTTAFYGSVSLVVSFVDGNGGKQLAVARAWSRMLLRIAGVTVVTSGTEKIQPGSSYVFAANHASYMDTPVVLANVASGFRFLAKKQLFSIPLLGGHLRRAGHIPVPKENPREAVRSMTEAGRIIRDRGISVLIFPEGGRSLNGLQEFREGAAYIAIKAGVPVVPVALRGTIDLLPMHSVHLKPGTVHLLIGDPIPTANLTLRDRGALTKELRDRVAELLE
jgi:1-acyl-sn-glycerol-3-phosphate acyltransferase